MCELNIECVNCNIECANCNIECANCIIECVTVTTVTVCTITVHTLTTRRRHGPHICCHLSYYEETPRPSYMLSSLLLRGDATALIYAVIALTTRRRHGPHICYHRSHYEKTPRPSYMLSSLPLREARFRICLAHIRRYRCHLPCVHCWGQSWPLRLAVAVMSLYKN